MALSPISFIEISENRTPTDAKCYRLDTPDGAELRVGVFPTTKKPARGNVMVCTGRSEFIEKYFEVVEDLTSRGFNAVVMDWRGQGLSSRLLPIAEKGHITTFETFTADLRFVTQEVLTTSFPNGPNLLLAHSMGGVPALHLLARGNHDYAGAVLCAPMTRLFSNPVKRFYVRTVARTIVKFNGSRQSTPGAKEYSLDFEGNILTSDRARHSRFRALQAAAPNATIGAPTFGWLKAATDAIDHIHKPRNMRALKSPCLIVSAGRDQLICSSDHQYLAQKNNAIECVTLKDALHEILMENNQIRDQFWTHFDDFVDRHI